MSHRRYNPLLDEWVLCSPGRLKRPWLGESDAPAPEPPPAYDPECYMCPGNQRASGESNPEYERVFVFDNDYPALSAMTGTEAVPDAAPLLVAKSERGRCRVMCFSPRHDSHLAAMTPPAVRRVVDVWADESERLAADENASFVQVFENRGAMMGASNPHPHGQIWATEHVPRRESGARARVGDGLRRGLGTDSGHTTRELRAGPYSARVRAAQIQSALTVFWRYWLLQVPGWVVLVGLLTAAHFWLELSPLSAVIVLALWFVKDAVLYPILKPHYVFRERDAHQGILGEQAVAQERLDPRGYVKLRGELWFAEIAADASPVPIGERVVVESVDGLKLRVRR